MKLGKRIAAVLKALGKKQVWLCEQVPGLEIGTLSALITRNSARSEFAVAIAKATGTRVEYLLDGELPMFISEMRLTHGLVEANSVELDLLEKYRKMTPDGQVLAHRMMDSLSVTYASPGSSLE